MKNRYKNKFNQLLTVLSTALLLAATGAYAGQTTRVSVNSSDALISADGRYVAYSSSGNTFIRNRGTGITNLVSLGLEGEFLSFPGAISADGRYVTFNVHLNFEPFGDNYSNVYDRVSGTTRFITDCGYHTCQANAISANGRYVAYWALSLEGYSAAVTDIFTGKGWDVYSDNEGEVGIFSDQTRAISADGRYVLFLYNDVSTSSFVQDLVTGTNTLVAADVFYYGDATPAAMSADGRFVVFTDLNVNTYVRDLLRLTTTRVCVNCIGTAISADGRFVVFNNGNIFVRDRVTGKATAVNVSSAGVLGNAASSFNTAISADGRYVAFSSDASNLVAGDTNGVTDVFVRDLLLDNTRTADLQVAMTSKPASLRRGQTASYTLTVKNNGPSLADQVNLTNIVFNGTVTSVLPNQGNCGEAAVIACHLNNLAAGASAKVVVSIKANSNPIIQQVSVNAAPRDNVSSNNGIWNSTPVVP